MIGSWDRSMGGGTHNASRLAHYCADKSFCTSFQSFNTCYKVKINGFHIVYYEMKEDCSRYIEN